jgi:hypothetical protein
MNQIKNFFKKTKDLWARLGKLVIICLLFSFFGMISIGLLDIFLKLGFSPWMKHPENQLLFISFFIPPTLGLYIIIQMRKSWYRREYAQITRDTMTLKTLQFLETLESMPETSLLQKEMINDHILYLTDQHYNHRRFKDTKYPDMIEELKVVQTEFERTVESIEAQMARRKKRKKNEPNSRNAH